MKWKYIYTSTLQAGPSWVGTMTQEDVDRERQSLAWMWSVLIDTESMYVEVYPANDIYVYRIFIREDGPFF